MKRDIELNDRHEMFCREFITDFNATRAYIAVYSVQSNGAARTNSSKLLANTNIQKRISELIRERSQKLEVTQEKVMLELASIAFSSMSDVIHLVDGQPRLKPDPDLSCIESMSLRGGADNPDLRIKTQDKLKALYLLGMHLGLFSGDHQAKHDPNARMERLSKALSNLGIGSKKPE